MQVRPSKIIIVMSMLALVFAGNVAFVNAEELIENNATPDFAPDYAPVITKTWLDVPDQVINSSQLDITQWVEIASPLPAGTIIAVEQPSFYLGQFQSLDSTQDNFISVESDASVVVKTMRRNSFPGLDVGSNFVVIVQFTSEISSRQRLGIRYSNLRIPSISYDKFALPLLVSVGDDFYQVDVDTFSIAPGSAKGLLVSAPSIIPTGKSFDAHVTVVDALGNPTDQAIPSLEILIDGIFSRRLERSNEPELLISDLIFEKEGLHRIDVRSSGGSLRGRSNLIYAASYNAPNIFWSDFHLHMNDHEKKGGFSAEVLRERNKTALDVLSIPGSRIFSSATSSEFHRPLVEGGNMILLNERYQIALGDVPVDHRRLDARYPILAEIIAGRSQYEWLGIRLAGLGYKVSFVGSQSSHLTGTPNQHAKSALLVRDGEDWQTALNEGRTYVVSEGRPILLVKINNADSGMRIPYSARRQIKGQVHAAYGIHTIELLKNGVVIDSKKPGTTANSNVIQIQMSSPNKPLTWDLPRNGREWIGYLKSSKGRITDVSTKRYGDRHNMASYSGDSSRLDFITWTHGGSRSFLVEVDSEDSKSLFELAIMAGFEDSRTQPRYRESKETPAVRLVFSLDQLEGNGITRTLETFGYYDQINIALLDTKLPTSYDFDFVDSTNVRPGDYYYVRITGAEDEMVWSSPVYVGGFDVRD